jgi:hypothetical protein
MFFVIFKHFNADNMWKIITITWIILILFFSSLKFVPCEKSSPSHELFWFYFSSLKFVPCEKSSPSYELFWFFFSSLKFVPCEKSSSSYELFWFFFFLHLNLFYVNLVVHWKPAIFCFLTNFCHFANNIFKKEYSVTNSPLFCFKWHKTGKLKKITKNRTITYNSN